MTEAIVLPNGEEFEVEEGELWFHWTDGGKLLLRLRNIDPDFIDFESLTYEGTNGNKTFTKLKFAELVEKGQLLPCIEGVDEIREVMEEIHG